MAFHNVAHLVYSAEHLAKFWHIWLNVMYLVGQMLRVSSINEMHCTFGQLRRFIKCALH